MFALAVNSNTVKQGVVHYLPVSEKPDANCTTRGWTVSVSSRLFDMYGKRVLVSCLEHVRNIP
jgi:hypothetical protein